MIKEHKHRKTMSLDELQTQNIFLVGLMGAGKTSVGRLLSRRMGKVFYDSDHVIEDRTGVKIMVIFDIEGETGFRSRERDVIKELVGKKGIVLATGGGSILDSENRQHLKNNGIVIYLHASVGELVRRTNNDSKRPLLRTKNVKAKLEGLYIERDPLYRSIADLIFETKNQSVAELVQRVTFSIKKNRSSCLRKR